MNNIVTRDGILLVFIDLRTKQEQNIVSPIQIMKGMFLAKEELKLEDFYIFEPYLYGPCSFQIYSDLLALQLKNFIKTIPGPSSWKYYTTTPLGSAKAKIIIEVLGMEKVKVLREIKELIISKSFLELLEYIYSKYPEYARNSIVNIEGFKK
jgi:DNA-binding PadR family transcriptional regulator